MLLVVNPKSIVYYDTIKNNKDYNKYDKIGIYEYGCGLDIFIYLMVMMNIYIMF